MRAWVWLWIGGCAWITPSDQDAAIEAFCAANPGAEDCPPIVAPSPTTCYTDVDADGIGDVTSAFQAPEGDCPAGSAPLSGDCDDDDPNHQDVLLWHVDQDGDDFLDEVAIMSCGEPAPAGQLASTVDGDFDCDDDNPSIHPGADEICNEFDDNCDDIIDDDAIDRFDAWRDSDGDGFGDSAQTPEQVCELPGGSVLEPGDCDDSEPAISPIAEEICDFVDNDCDGDIDEDVLIRHFFDGDRDGYGTLDTELFTCQLPDGGARVLLPGDCEDENPDINPGEEEECNGEDSDCDGTVDNGDDRVVVYEDLDGDGFGTDGNTQLECDPPVGFAEASGDCDDENPNVSPGQVEICGDTIDNDCDVETTDDQGDTFYQDADGDGFGDDAVSVMECEQPEGYVLDATDCNDANAAQAPDRMEGPVSPIDLNCDDQVLCYIDTDLDEFGTTNTLLAPRGVGGLCSTLGLSTNDDDCNDADPSIHPDAVDIIGNDADENCDDELTCYVDTDNDGFGAANTVGPGTTTRPVMPNGCLASGAAANDDDCNDSDSDINPTEPQICNGINDNCSASWVGRETDNDGDGFWACVGLPPSLDEPERDCDDSNNLISPIGVEVCNADFADDNCNGVVDDDGLFSLVRANQVIASGTSVLALPRPFQHGDVLQLCQGDSAALSLNIPTLAVLPHSQPMPDLVVRGLHPTGRVAVEKNLDARFMLLAANTDVSFINLSFDGTDGFTSSRAGDCFNQQPDSRLSIIESDVHDCETVDGVGGAISMQPGSLLNISSSELLGNKANLDGGAIFCTDCDSIHISNSTLTENEAREGGAVNCDPCNTLDVVSSTFRDNTTTGNGGAIRVRRAVLPASTVSITDTLFEGNATQANGGALALGRLADADVQLEMTSVVFRQNTAVNGLGGALWGHTVFDDTPMGQTALTNVTVRDNTAVEGGGFYLDNSLLEIGAATFTTNTANVGQAMVLNRTDITLDGSVFTGHDMGTSPDHAAIVLTDSGSSTVAMTTTTFTDNAYAFKVDGGRVEGDQTANWTSDQDHFYLAGTMLGMSTSPMYLSFYSCTSLGCSQP